MPDESNLQYVTLLRRRWKLIPIAGLCGLILAFAVTLVIPKRYTATTQLYVSAQTGLTAADLQQGNSFAQAQIQSYGSVVTTSSVLSSAASSLGMSGPSVLAPNISASVTTGSVILSISASAKTALFAAREANAVAASFKALAPHLDVGTTGTSPIKVTTVQPANPPLAPSSPKKKLNLVLGLFVGLGLGALLAIVVGMLDTKLADATDVEEVTGDAPTLAIIPMSRGTKSGHIAFGDNPNERLRAEAYRHLRTAVHFASLGAENDGLLFTSAIPAEGKTSTVLNLAVALGEAGANVVLVDADMRKPSVARYAGLDNRVGLSNVLVGDAELDEALQRKETATGGVSVLSSGPIPPNPSELVGSSAFDELLTELKRRFDVVLVDGPPINVVSEASVLAAKLGGVVLVVGMQVARKPDLRRAMGQLETVHARLLGVAINRMQPRALGRGYDAYYHYSAEETGPAKSADNATKESQATG